MSPTSTGPKETRDDFETRAWNKFDFSALTSASDAPFVANNVTVPSLTKDVLRIRCSPRTLDIEKKLRAHKKDPFVEVRARRNHVVGELLGRLQTHFAQEHVRLYDPSGSPSGADVSSLNHHFGFGADAHARTSLSEMASLLGSRFDVVDVCFDFSPPTTLEAFCDMPRYAPHKKQRTK